MSRYVINIADSSITYWNRYDGLNTQGGNTQVNIAPWLAADAVGALAGAIGAGLDSYLNTGSVNWKSVGAWALGGAVGASIPGTGWFKGFFKL